MLQLTPQSRIFVATAPVDFRKGIDGLAAVCRQVLGANPLEGAVYVFRNRAGTALKLLLYDGQGYWLCMKRLSQGIPFVVPFLLLYQKRFTPYHRSKQVRKWASPVTPKTSSDGGLPTSHIRAWSVATRASCPSKSRRWVIPGNVAHTSCAFLLAERLRNSCTKSRNKRSRCPGCLLTAI